MRSLSYSLHKPIRKHLFNRNVLYENSKQVVLSEKRGTFSQNPEKIDFYRRMERKKNKPFNIEQGKNGCETETNKTFRSIFRFIVLGYYSSHSCNFHF